MKTSLFKRAVSFAVALVMILLMVPISEISVNAASNLEYIENETSNLEYIENESGTGNEFELLGKGFNALGNSELNYTTLKLKAMLDYNELEALVVSGSMTHSSATYATSAQEMMYELGIDYSSKQSLTTPLDILKLSFTSKFDAALNKTEKALEESQLYYYTNETIFRKYAANIYDAGSADILSEEFQKALDSLNASYNDVAIAAFYETWGTHMLTSYNSGAFLEYVAYSYSFSADSKLSSELTSAMENTASIGSAVDVSTVDSIHLKLDTMQSTDTLKVKSAWYAYGGKSELSPSELAQDLTKTQTAIDEWTDKLTDDSGVMIPHSTQWMPIWELVPSEYADLKVALQDYYQRQANGINAAFFAKFTNYSEIKGATDIFYKSPTGHISKINYASEKAVAPGSMFNVVNLDADLSGVEFQISGPATVDEHGIVTVNPNATSGTISIKIADLEGNQIGGERTYKITKEGAGLFAGGYGDAERPYLIATAKQFNNIRQYNGKHFVLIDDIDFNDIGTETPIESFSGVLDGNGYTIFNWKYIQTTAGMVGIFKSNTSDGQLKNFTISLSEINFQDGAAGDEYIGMVCGANYGQISNVVIVDCKLYDDMGSIKSDSNNSVAAGFICGVNVGIIDNCGARNNYMSIYSGSKKKEGYAHSFAGGIAGVVVDNASFENVYAYGNTMIAQAKGEERFFGNGSSTRASASGIIGAVYGEGVQITRGIAYNNNFSSSAVEGEWNTSIEALLVGYSLYSITAHRCYVCETGLVVYVSGSYSGVIKTTMPVTVENLDTFIANGWIQNDDLSISQCMSLSVNTQDAQTTYFVGEPLNLEGLVIDAVKNDAAESRVTIERGYTVSGYDPNTAGVQTITVTYGKISGTYEVNVVKPEVTEVVITSLPNRTAFFAGEEFDAAGITAIAKYSDGSSVELSEDDLLIEHGTLELGQNTVTVTYQNHSDSYTVDVCEVLPVKIAVAGEPKTNYAPGEALDLSGLSLKVTYNNYEENNAAVTEDMLNLSNCNMDVPGVYQVCITYQGVETSYEIVVGALKSIRIAAQPNKLTYVEGEEIDLAGIVIVADYDNGTSQVITDYTVSGYDSTPGTKTVTVSYEGATATFEVTVAKMAIPEGAPQIVVQSVNAAAGSTVTVEVTVQNNPGIASLRFHVAYDESALELVGYQDMQILNGFSQPSPVLASPYTLRWADSQATSNNDANGVVIRLTFAVADDAASGDYSISIVPVEARTCTGEKITFYGSEASVTVLDFILGDVDMDGEVTDWDGILLNRYLAGWNGIDINMNAADVDCDGEVSDWDGILLDRYLAGWNVQFG